MGLGGVDQLKELLAEGGVLGGFLSDQGEDRGVMGDVGDGEVTKTAREVVGERLG